MEIADILPLFRKLNNIYTLAIERSELEYEEQRFVFEFYKNNEDILLFETMLINFNLESKKEKFSMLIDCIRSQIKQNIFLYTEHKSFFDKINTISVCRTFANRNDYISMLLRKESCIYSRECHKINGYLDSIGFRKHAQYEVDELMEELEDQKAEYNRYKKEIGAYYIEKKKDEKEAFQYVTNCFKSINQLSESFLLILNDYTTDDLKTQNKSDGEIYFEMDLVSKVYQVCNKEQFDDLSELDFYHNLNLLSTNSILQVKSKENTRTCYLIHKLYEHIEKDSRRTEWRSSILQLLSISQGTFNSKYYEPANELASKRSKEFTSRIQAIFK